jgi:hypothetical protein
VELVQKKFPISPGIVPNREFILDLSGKIPEQLAKISTAGFGTLRD